MGKRAPDISGQKFGRWTVAHRVDLGTPAVYWQCVCECGTNRPVRGSLLVNGTTKSCGCFGLEIRAAANKTHGMYGTLEHRSWTAMKRRCTYEKHPRYARYGGRGITVCSRWLDSFENFYADMGPCPYPDGSIERVDNDGNYTPENCVWLPKGLQSRNRNVCRKGQHAEI